MALDLTINAPQRFSCAGAGSMPSSAARFVSPARLSPRAVGEFTLRRGRLTLLSRRLNFTRGTLGFSGSLTPTLDLAAESSPPTRRSPWA